MIVLLSRARLGMFILGNIDYFEAKPDPSIRYHTVDLFDHVYTSNEILGYKRLSLS